MISLAGLIGYDNLIIEKIENKKFYLRNNSASTKFVINKKYIEFESDGKAYVKSPKKTYIRRTKIR